MITVKFKECCKGCSNRKTYLNEHEIHSDGRVHSVYTTIGCEHENVCKDYIEGGATECRGQIVLIDANVGTASRKSVVEHALDALKGITAAILNVRKS